MNFYRYLIFSIHIGIYTYSSNKHIKNIKMCTEFLLAIIYFATIFFVNYFLSKLLKTYFKNIFYLLRLKNIFKSFKKSNNTLVYFLSSLLQKEKRNSTPLLTLHKFCKTQDVLIIGNTYKYLSTNLKYEASSNNKLYYLELLANQYLSTKKEKTKPGSPGNWTQSFSVKSRVLYHWVSDPHK